MKTNTENTVSVKGYGKSMILVTLLSLLLILLQSCSEDESIVVENPDELNEIAFDYLTVDPEAEVKTSVLNYYDDGSSNLTLKFFDVQRSSDDTRPLILLAPGGAWREYNRVPEIEKLANNLAKRGYAAAVVNYTIGQQDGDTWLQSVKDFSVAIKFFKKYSTEYKIDPDNIFTGGWSTGAQLAMYAQHLDFNEYEGFEQNLIKQILDPSIEEFGFESSLYQEYSAKVKGNLLMMPYAWKEDFLDNAGPMMMIANRNSAFIGGVKIWGDNVFVNGLMHIGPDAMKESFEQLGLIDGQDLELIITDPALESQVEHINYTPLDSSHFDVIASFFQRNL